MLLSLRIWAKGLRRARKSWQAVCHDAEDEGHVKISGGLVLFLGYPRVWKFGLGVVMMFFWLSLPPPQNQHLYMHRISFPFLHSQNSDCFFLNLARGSSSLLGRSCHSPETLDLFHRGQLAIRKEDSGLPLDHRGPANPSRFSGGACKIAHFSQPQR